MSFKSGFESRERVDSLTQQVAVRRVTGKAMYKSILHTDNYGSTYGAFSEIK